MIHTQNVICRVTNRSLLGPPDHEKVTQAIVLRINSFGGLSVERDGRPLTGAAAQPRRMAILALLARADERGVTRDRVMSLLWPDMDEERARRALTQALYALRQDLGDDEAIAGVKELRLDLERISTDLHEFRRAKSRDSLDDAAAAYRGPFLDGFHLPGADEFERWADQERRGLAREYAELVERLAFLAEKHGDFSAAVGWWRRLAAVDPLSARVAVSLMRALAAAGDPHAAIQHARVHEALLAQELELPADREVAALAAQLRSEARRQSTEAQVSAPNQEAQVSALNQPVEAELPRDSVAAREPAGTQAPVPPHPSLGAAADASAVSSVQAATRPRERRWRRSWLIAGAVAAAAGLMMVARPTASTLGLAEQPVVVVGRIADYSGESTGSLGSPIGDMLATNLARAPGLHVVSSARMYEILGRTASSSRDTTLGVVIAAARLAGATDLIDGAIHRVGEGKLRLDIQRVDVSSGAVIRAYTVVGDDLFALADSGSLRLVRHIGTTLPPGSLADVTTKSAVAYRFYAEGLRAYSTGERERADSLFVAALNEDSTFAMATYYHATLTRNPIATLARAVELSGSASERERLIIRSEWAYASSSPSILAFAESLAVRYPAELEGHLYLGRAFVNLGRFMESVPLLQRVVDMDSASLSGRTVSCSACAALSWMLSAYLHADSSKAAERVARRWVAVQGGSPSPWISLGVVLEIQSRWSEASEAYAVVSRLDSRNPDAWEIQVPILLRRGELAAAERLASQHVAGSPFGSSWWTVVSRRYAGRVEAAIDEARRGLAAVGPSERPSSMLQLLAQSLLDGGQHHMAAIAFDSLVRAPDPRLDSSDFARQRAWALTHVADALAAAGDTIRLEAIADSVRLLGAQTSYGRDRRLFHHVRGLLLRARGDSGAAADEFRAAIWSPTFGYTRSNLELAKTLLTLSRPREAVAILQPALRGSLEASNLYVTHTELHEQLGRAWEAVGRTDSAAVHYEYVARAWEHGDPPFASRGARAKAKLSALPLPR